MCLHAREMEESQTPQLRWYEQFKLRFEFRMSQPTTGLAGLEKQNSSACKHSHCNECCRGTVGGVGRKISIKMPNKPPLNEIWHICVGPSFLLTGL